MSDSVGAVLSIILFVSVPSLMLWVITSGLRTGVIRGRGGPIARSEFPIGYWIELAGYMTVFCVWMYFLGTVALDIWRDGWN